MRLTLDWDNITQRELERRLLILWKELEREPGWKPHWKKSSSGKNYHVVVRNLDIDFDTCIKLRKRFWDDPNRIKVDLQNHKRELPCNVLFTEKKDNRDNKTSNETNGTA